MITYGVTVGKFWPFHLGHDLMIRAGVENQDLDHLTVIISNDTREKNEIVSRQMCNRYKSEIYHNKLNIVCHVDDEPNPEVDENGIAVDKDYIKRWTNTLLKIQPNITHFVSSDLYGQVIAEMMGIKWFPVDPDRIAVPISSTAIRENIRLYWNFIVPEAQVDWSYKIAIVGAESVGKSTLVENVPKNLGYAVCPEYGRTISEVYDNNLNLETFRSIITTQQLMIEQASKQNPIVVTDTEAIITHLFADIYLDDISKEIFRLNRHSNIKRNNIDFYIVLAPTVEWKDDGTRIVSKQSDREKFHTKLLINLEVNDKDYIVIDSADYNERQKAVYDVLIQKYNPKELTKR